MGPTLENLTSEYPFVSIIMPLRNEGLYIQRCLDSVLEQDYPQGKMEIIVADGLSEDNTREVIRLYQQENPFIKLLDNQGKIVPTGLNSALKISTGDFIVRVDGHCVIAADYVRLCVTQLMQDSVDCVGGQIETIGETSIARAIALAMSSPFGVGGGNFRTIKGQTRFVDTVAFPAYRRETIQEIGLFDEELVRNQDDEYNYRLRASGGRILLDSNIRSRYYSRTSLSALWRQYFQYGFWKVRVLQKHPRQMSLRQFLPLGFVNVLIFSLIISLFFKPLITIFGLLIGLYIFINLTVSAWIVCKNGIRYFFILPIVFLILHFSYGLGFSIGLIRFAHRWCDKVGRIPNYTIE